MKREETQRRNGETERQTLFLLMPTPGDNGGIYVCLMRFDGNVHETEVADTTI